MRPDFGRTEERRTQNCLDRSYDLALSRLLSNFKFLSLEFRALRSLSVFLRVRSFYLVGYAAKKLKISNIGKFGIGYCDEFV